VDDLLVATLPSLAEEATHSSPVQGPGKTPASLAASLAASRAASPLDRSLLPGAPSSPASSPAAAAQGETAALRAELEAVRAAAAAEKAAAARRVRDLESTVERLQSESLSRASVSSFSPGGGGGDSSAGEGGYGVGFRQSLSGVAPRQSFSGSGLGGGSLGLMSGSEAEAEIMSLSAAADHASLVAPLALVGHWVTVEGRGLGRVIAFHKQWRPGTDSLHVVEFGGWAGRGGRREELLLRRPKLSKVSGWGSGAMNGGLLFTLALPPHGFGGDAAAHPMGAGDGGGGGGGGGSGSGGDHGNGGASRQPTAAQEAGGSIETRAGPESSGAAAVDRRAEERSERMKQRSLQRVAASVSVGLPAGWSAALDPATRRPFFVNAATGESTWESPV